MLISVHYSFPHSVSITCQLRNDYFWEGVREKSDVTSCCFGIYIVLMEELVVV